jgi:hypothetical protein
MLTTVPCKHWSRGDMVNGGVCAIGSNDPNRPKGTPRTHPGFSECARCPHYDGPPRPAPVKTVADAMEESLRMERLIHGPPKISGCCDPPQGVRLK